MLGGAVVAVETSLTMGCTLGTVVVTGEVVVEPEPGAEVLRDRTWGRKEGKVIVAIVCCLPHTRKALVMLFLLPSAPNEGSRSRRVLLA